MEVLLVWEKFLSACRVRLTWYSTAHPGCLIRVLDGLDMLQKCHWHILAIQKMDGRLGCTEGYRHVVPYRR